MKIIKYSVLIILFLFFGSSLHAKSEFVFHNDRQLRKTIKKKVWPTLKKNTPKAYSLKVSAFFLNSLPYSNYDRLAKDFGFKPNDVSVAETYFCTNSAPGIPTSYARIHL